MMKYLFIFSILLIISICGISQSITAPSPLTIEATASNVDAGNFVVNWPNNTDQLLISISLDYQSSATLSFPTTTSLTRNYGYNSWTGVTSIVFYGTRDNVNVGLAAMTISMGAVKTAVRINIEISQYDASYVYNPTNKHFYKFVSGAINYTNAKAGATAQATFRGKNPYLATITSSSENDFINNNISYNNIWVAMSDASTEGRWIYDAGPEENTNFWNTSASGITNTTYSNYASNGDAVSGQYANWCANEPNNSDGSRNGEDQVVAKSGGATCWNDLADGNSGSVSGYLVEISADFPAGSDYTGVYSSYIVHNNTSAFTKTSSTGINSSSISNIPNLFGGLQVNDGHTITLRSGYTLNTNRIDLIQSGKVVFTDSTTKWIPGLPNFSNTFTHSPNTNTNPIYWSASSIYNDDLFSTSTASYYTPYLNSIRGWSAGSSDISPSIILNYDVPTYIAGIVTQARANFSTGQWVTTANIDVSLDGSSWKPILSGASLTTNISDAFVTYFPSVEYAKYVRVSPKSSFNYPSLRMGLIIKTNNITTDGLALHLDAGNLVSFKGTGTSWKDLSGNSNDASMNNVTYNSIGGHFEFNGTNSYIDFIANIGTPSVITVEMWIKVNTLGGMIFGFNLYDVWTANNHMGFNTGNSDQFGIPSTQVTTLGIVGKWKHLVFVMNQGTTVGNKIYVNGVNQIMSFSTGAIRSNAIFNSGEGRISSWKSNTSYLMNMHLGNFRIYKRELTQQEINDNFIAQRARFGL